MKTAETVADRKRARRAAPGLAKPKKATATIDLSKPDARKQLTALYPRPETDKMLDASKGAERAAAEYFSRREDEARAKLAKDVAGNVLLNEIAKNRGLVGDGWKVTWDMKKGNVDWSAVVKEANIPQELIEKHRLPETRTIDVRELANEEE